MDNLKEEYDEIVNENEEVLDQINVLEQDDKVKKYFELCDLRDKLVDKQKELYNQIKINEYLSCNHIWVRTFIDYEKNKRYCGCIKCGLNQVVFYLNKLFNAVNMLSLDQQIMFDYMKNNSYMNGIDTEILCDFDLAKAIYLRIKELYPNLDDETIIKYFETAVDDIIGIRVNDERKASRIKRLNLNPKFNNWNPYDLHSQRYV